MHLGDRIYFENNEASLQQEVRRLQDSLYYQHMHERYESLREAADGTYKWILEPGANGELTSRQEQMTAFLRWFRNGSGTFWVSGKPGSGKSTLMKYLVEHAISESGNEYIPRYSIVLSFFFWIGGTDLQRNKTGCMRSLLWQALQSPSTRELAVQICQSQFRGAWTERHLKVVLSSLLERMKSPIAIFLDGLDESDDHDEILNFLYLLGSSSNVKLCVSSRPEATLIHILGAYQSLRLQDLNHSDIQHVIKTTFLEDARVQALYTRQDPNTCQSAMFELSEAIGYKAEGVFLWVILVIKDLLRGIAHRDDISILYKRLQKLPNDISALYEDLLRRAQSDTGLYKDEAALYLSLALHGGFNVVEFCFAINADLREEYLHSSVFDTCVGLKTAIDCEAAITLICTRTAGLLEVSDGPDLIYYTPAYGVTLSTVSGRILPVFQAFQRYGRRSVQFIHRTARDFLQSTAQGQYMIEKSLFSSASIEQICFETKLICHAILPGLFDFSFSGGAACSILSCKKCSDKVVFGLLKDQGQRVMDSLYSAGVLLPDANNWMFSQRECYSSNRKTYSFPSSKYAVVDLLPALIRYKRWTIARMWLDGYDCIGDSVYLTMLLIGLFDPEYVDDNPEEGFLELLQILLERGADLSKEIKINTGETLCPLSAVLARISATPVPVKKEEIYHLLNLHQFDLSTKSRPSCAGCHEIWYENIEHYYYDVKFEFWGDLGAPEAVQLGTREAFYSADYALHSGLGSETDRIFVVASCVRRSGTSVRVPRLWAISAMDSKRLRNNGKKTWQFVEGRYDISAPGICEVKFLPPNYTEGGGAASVLRSEIEAICEESPPLTYAQAMKLLNKTQDMIEGFYQCEAKRMERETETEQERWKQWFWGDEIPAASG